MIDRRTFMTCAGGVALGATLPVGAQTPRVARLGVLATQPPSSPTNAPSWKAFYGELQARGWVEGRNLAVEARYTEGRPDLERQLAAEVVAAGVEVIVAGGSQAVSAARDATRTVPIVMTNVSHVVEAGYVASLARPGGNITGVTNQLGDLMAKHFELLRTARPDTRKIGVLWSPDNLGSAIAFKDMQMRARDLGLALVSLPVDRPDELDPALLLAQRESVQALHVHPTAVIGAHWRRISAWATDRKVVTISGFNGFTRGGFLLSYGADFADIWRIAATFVDRILRGAKPADLPVEQPTKFELVINLKTAKTLGLTIPQQLLSRADEVIQ